MKVTLIVFVVIAILIVFYAIFISLKALNQVKKNAKQDFEQKQKIRHPQIDKELAELERQRQNLTKAKSSKKKK